MYQKSENDTFLYVSYGVIIFIMGLVLFSLKEQLSMSQTPSKDDSPVISKVSPQNIQSGTFDEREKYPKTIVSDPIGDVPFTAQAPSGNWSNIIYEEGCEEASILMALHWSRKIPLTSSGAMEEIKNISEYEQKTYNTFVDTSVYDTAKTLENYYKFKKFRLVDNIEKNDIVESLKQGNIVLIPAYGRDLKNPNYTPPGPVPHMLVIIGYDAAKKQFITNDPGTKNGKGFRYNEDVLFNAIWTYPTSAEKIAPPKTGEKRHKSMIEVWR